MITRAIVGVSLFLVATCMSPAWAQRGPGGGGGGGGGGCGVGGASQSTSSNLAATAFSPYTQSPMAAQYALQRMQQQQYVQQAMAFRQMVAQLQMENQSLRAQMLQMHSPEQVAQANSPFNAQGDSNQLLAPKKSTSKARATAAKKTTDSRARTVVQRAEAKASSQPVAIN